VPVGTHVARWVLPLGVALALLPAVAARADTDADRAQLLGRMADIVRASGVAGAAVALVTGDGIWAQASGGLHARTTRR
jgi:hypothetical protein